MDIVTNDLAQVRPFLAARGGPAHCVVAPGQAQRRLIGGGLPPGRGHPVSMAGFGRGDREMLYRFILDRAAAKAAPPPAPHVAQVNKPTRLGWRRGDRACVLAGRAEAAFRWKYPQQLPARRDGVSLTTDACPA